MYVVIGPGAMGTFAYFGALSALGLDRVDEVSGCSAGAILGLLICTGKTIEEIRDFIFNVNIKELTKVNILSLINNFGFISHGPIKKLLKEFCGDPTFKDLSKKLYVTSYCLNKMETEYFSVDNSPDMSVVDAVCMSMSVPFLFESVKYNTYRYVDGATCEHYPMLAFLHKDPKDVLIIRLERHKKCIPEIKNIKEFIMCLVNIASESPLAYKSFSREITIDIIGVNIFDFLMSDDDKMKLYVIGYQTALSHLGSFK
jgi:predicted acylesterase/phospholipase RssA